jgi:flagellar capping protein FliD
MSGMDTESMVKKMLSGTQTKIDTQKQQKQQLQWKQDSYRECITTINALYDSYFNASYGADITNNLASSKFFNQKAAVSSAGNVSIISTDPSAQLGDMSVVVKQLASKAQLTSTKEMSGDRTITGTALMDDMLATFQKTVSLKVNGSDISVDLNSANTQDEIVAAFNQALAGKGVTASASEGKLSLTADASTTTISVNKENSTALGLSASGLSVGSSASTTDEKTALKGTDMTPAAGVSFQLSFDGVTKTITLNDIASDANGKVTAENLLKSLKQEMRTSFGNYVSVDLTGAEGDTNRALKFSIAADGGSRGHELKIYGSNDTPLASSFGITPGASSSINTSTKLGDISGIAGGSYAFSINGVNFSFTKDNTLSEVIGKINSSKAGVQIGYSSLSDTFSMTSTSTGKQYGIEIEQTSGNLMTALFGEQIDAAASVSSNALNTGSISGTALPDDYNIAAASLKMNVNGKDYTFSLAAKSDHAMYTKADIKSELSRWLNKNFGDSIQYSGGNLTTKAGYAVTLDTTTETTGVVNLGKAMGFAENATNTAISKDTPTANITQLQGSTITYKDSAAAQTLDNIASIDGVAVSYADGRLTLTNTPTTDGSGNTTYTEKTVDLTTNALKALFGSDKTASITLSGGKATEAEGKDALLTVNGVDITRSSNSFTLDGITMQANSVSTNTGTEADPVYAATTITTGQDSDSIVTTLKAFVKDYNALIDKFQGLLSEDAEYKDYAPLTDEQEADMSDSEIEKWTVKAKTGLLRNDDELSSFLSNMRSALYSKSSSSDVALYDIGIETYDKTGKLTINESTLRKAIASDPEGIANLFTDSTDGLSKKMMTAMENSAKLSTGTPGSLVSLAGSKSVTSSLTNNTIYRQLKDIDDKVDQLKDRYENEKDRYWSMFNSMETAMSSYNTQMSLLSSYFSSGS